MKSYFANLAEITRAKKGNTKIATYLDFQMVIDIPHIQYSRHDQHSSMCKVLGCRVCLAIKNKESRI